MKKKGGTTGRKTPGKGGRFSFNSFKEEFLQHRISDPKFAIQLYMEKFASVGH